MSNDIVFLFDKIDPDKGLIPNLSEEPLPSSGQNTYERFLKKTFSNYKVKFKPSYFCEEESGWLYPVFINNLWFLNSVTQIENKLPKKVQQQIWLKKGKVIVFIYEPFFQDMEEFKKFESIASIQTPEFIYCVMHESSIPNIIFYDSCILERNNGHIWGVDDTHKQYLQNKEHKKFSCFLNRYYECNSRFLFLSFLEKTKIIEQIYISARNQAKDFKKYLKGRSNNVFYDSNLNFSSFEKTFNLLNIEETLEKSLIHIIFEGEIVANSDRRHISEKVYRCIEAKVPFILISHPHALKYFRKLGFKSFPKFINENYDKEEDQRKRLTMIFAEIKRLSEIPFDQLEKQIQELKPIFDHNLKILNDNHTKTQNNIYRILNGT